MDDDARWLGDATVALRSTPGVRPAVADSAALLLACLEAERFDVPVFAATAGGGIKMSWCRLDRGLDVVVESAGEFRYVRYPTGGGPDARTIHGVAGDRVVDQARGLVRWFRTGLSPGR